MYCYELYIFVFICIYYLIYLNTYDVIESKYKKTLYFNDNDNIIPILI